MMMSQAYNRGACGVGCVQGAREYQEDRSTEMQMGNTQWFSVHDGHGGSKAVDKLVAWLGTEPIRRDILIKAKELHVEWDVNNDQRMDFVSQIYYEALRELEGETSGAVSISALCVPGAIYLGWIGDCQGYVFSERNRAPTCVELDFADLDRRPRKIQGAFTSPHCFSSIPHIITGEKTASSSSSEEYTYSSTEMYTTQEKQKVIKFPDARSHEEWERIVHAHKMTPNKDRLVVDRTVLLIGSQRLLVDARVSMSIQPTRALGDCNEIMALRHPSVMRVSMDNSTSSRVLLLCSDGVFSRGAFADIHALSLCVSNPLMYFLKKSFYRRGQEITERLLACGKLYSCDGSEEDDFLWNKLHDVNSWHTFIIFLRKYHLAAVDSPEMWSTFTNEKNHTVMGCLMTWGQHVNAGHTEWLNACTKSVEWLETNHSESGGVKKPTLHISGGDKMANIAAHLAVIMGSSDNVTVLVAKPQSWYPCETP